MYRDLFFEIGTEEIPARFINSALNDINNIIKNYLDELKISFKNVEVYATPRRFAVVIRELNEKQNNLEDFIKGPSKKIAFDENGNPSKALLGFVNSRNGTIENIETVKNGNEEYVYLRLFKEGKDTVFFIKDILDKVIRNINFPKPMKWGNKNIKFIRPIRWLVCIFGNEVIKFDIEGINTSNITKGHRFLGSNEIEVLNFDDYKQKLEENFVILDHLKRKNIIKNQAILVSEQLGGNVIIDEEILDEVNFIVEYPTAFYGSFDKDYLSLPKEVVITPMQNHQRYFPVVDKSGNLMNYFITVRNGNDYMIDNVRKGNNKVLDARLKDAQFFFNEDIKKKLEDYIENLKTIVFHEKLGTMYDKVERIKKLSLEISRHLNFNMKDIERAAILCKADLTTQMVFEFGELQGIMGRYYANMSGENEEVSNAIFEHYLPRNSDDDIAKTECGIALALADKMDTISGFFLIGIQPTGSQDPYALRRQAIGVLTTAIKNRLEISINDLINLSLLNLKNEVNAEIKGNMYDFFILRLNNILLDMGVRYDIVNAMHIHKDIPIYKIVSIADELMSWLKNNDKYNEFTTFNRANNLLKDVVECDINEKLFLSDSEKKLFDVQSVVNEKANYYIDNMDYISALKEIEKIVPSIDYLFETVMIMDKDENIKNNRLTLLRISLKVIKSLFDIEKINYK